jgi:two-component system catabolic regulation response regulator CreB
MSASPKHRILIVEDEAAIADTLLYALHSDGFDAEHVALGRNALDRVRAEAFDLVLLDVGLPDMHGFELCRALRQQADVPVIFLTARNDEIDRIVGLEIGADDYITKPFSPREVVARVRVVLRRLRPRAEAADTTPGPPPAALQIDLARAQARYHGQALALTRYELHLLHVLAAHPARVFSREQLMAAVWTDPNHATDRTVDTHIKTLRAKLRAVAPEADPIRTHRGLGYAYVPDTDAPGP